MSRMIEDPIIRNYVSESCEFVLAYFRKAWWRHSLPKWCWTPHRRTKNTQWMEKGQRVSAIAIRAALNLGLVSEQVDVEKYPLLRLVLTAAEKDKDRYLSDPKELTNMLQFVLSVDIAREIG